MNPIETIAVHDWQAPVPAEVAAHALDALEAGCVLRLPLPFALGADEKVLLSDGVLSGARKNVSYNPASDTVKGADGDVMLEPQLQLIYTNYRADDHRERNGTLVQSRTGGGLTTRLGVRLYHAPDPDAAPTWLPYAEVNWWHNADQNAIAFDNDLVTQGGPGNRGEVKAGMQAQLGKRWRVWGDVAFQRGGAGQILPAVSHRELGAKLELEGFALPFDAGAK